MKFPVPIGVIIALSSLRVAFTYPREPSSTSRYSPYEGHSKLGNTLFLAHPSSAIRYIPIASPFFTDETSRAFPDVLKVVPRNSKSPKTPFYYQDTFERERKLSSKVPVVNNNRKNVFVQNFSKVKLNKTVVNRVGGGKRPSVVATSKFPLNIKLNRPAVRKNVTVVVPSKKRVVSSSTLAPKLSGNKQKKPAVIKFAVKPAPVRKVQKPAVIASGSTKLKKRPTVLRNETKTSWADYNIPIPNPMPEVTSHSPPFAINNALPLNVDDSVITDLLNPINNFKLDMVPSGSNGGGLECPTVHISSSMLSPQQKQGCSDLNLVINSHFHQNSATQRTPENVAADDVLTYDAEEAVADDPSVAADEALAADAPAQAADAPAAAPPAPAEAASAAQPAASGATPGGGTGGTGGNGGNGSNGGSGWDWKGIGEFLQFAWGGISHILRFLKNPWLYIIPFVFFFTLAFLFKLSLFPWWLPALLLFIKPKDQSNIAYYKHVHKPIHHPDGWFWNHNTKTWTNVADYKYKISRIDTQHNNLHNRNNNNNNVQQYSNHNYNQIPKMIEDFSKQYVNPSNTRLETWKKRKKINR